jgi:hypothetical protein
MRVAEPILSLTGPPLHFPPRGKTGRPWLLEPEVAGLGQGRPSVGVVVGPRGRHQGSALI